MIPTPDTAPNGVTNGSATKFMLPRSCDENNPQLIVNVLSTPATQQDVSTTQAVHQALADKHYLPKEQLVDAGYIDAELLVAMKRDFDVQLIGPPRRAKGWQTKELGAFTVSDFEVNWDDKQATCPAGKTSAYWKPISVAVTILVNSSKCVSQPTTAELVHSESGVPAPHSNPGR